MQKSLVLDTCLLVLLMVGLTNKKYIGKHKRLHPVYNSAHFEKLLAMVRGARLVCTAHILTETSNLLRQISDPMKSEIQETMRRYVDRMDEVQIPGKQACKAQSFIRLGLTDAAIIMLNPKTIHILSVDLDLIVEAYRNGFHVTNLTPFLHDRASFS